MTTDSKIMARKERVARGLALAAGYSPDLPCASGEGSYVMLPTGIKAWVLPPSSMQHPLWMFYMPAAAAVIKATDELA